MSQMPRTLPASQSGSTGLCALHDTILCQGTKNSSLCAFAPSLRFSIISSFILTNIAYMPSITAAATILLVKDVVTSANWYRDKLGFTIVNYYGEPPGFAIIQRDGHYLMFHTVDEKLIKPNWKIADKTSNVYFWVEDIETLYADFIEREATIDYTLYPAPWGVNEFGVNDPDGYDISFGEIIRKSEESDTTRDRKS